TINSVVTNPSCVNCHGLPAEDKNVEVADSFRKEEGVNCCACHGPYLGWVTAHCPPGAGRTNAKWRKEDRTSKEQKYGMRDLWDPAERARLCNSCHIG